MPANYVLLAEQTVSQPVASVTFSNIPQTGYTDLIVNYSMRSTFTSGTGNTIQVSFNNSTSSFSDKNVYGSGTSAASSSSARNIGATPSATALANTFGNGCLYIPNYTSSNFKSFTVDAVQENNTSEAYNQLHSGLWSNTSAITSITITSNVNSIAQFSTFYLYGVAALGTTPVIAPKATGGDIVVNDGTYWYHAFLTSGTFTPSQALTCNYLVVAGGGGGGGGFGAGGGAGGLRSTVTATGGGGTLESALSLLASTGYAVTIGAGGTKGIYSTVNAGNGSNSVFSTITSTGGGGGAANTGTTPLGGQNGGSGGGGAGSGTTARRQQGLGTANQGYDGGLGNNTPQYGAGGGGGAGGFGANGSTYGGAGGVGVAISALATATGTGVSNYYAGGGGGGSNNAGDPTAAGGAGGGGASGNQGVEGTANTGGGGGGSTGETTTTTTGGNGGSGIVIVRYTMA